MNARFFPLASLAAAAFCSCRPPLRRAAAITTTATRTIICAARVTPTGIAHSRNAPSVRMACSGSSSTGRARTWCRSSAFHRAAGRSRRPTPRWNSTAVCASPAWFGETPSSSLRMARTSMSSSSMRAGRSSPVRRLNTCRAASRAAFAAASASRITRPAFRRSRRPDQACRSDFTRRRSPSAHAPRVPESQEPGNRSRS